MTRRLCEWCDVERPRSVTEQTMCDVPGCQWNGCPCCKPCRDAHFEPYHATAEAARDHSVGGDCLLIISDDPAIFTWVDCDEAIEKGLATPAKIEALRLWEWDESRVPTDLRRHLNDIGEALMRLEGWVPPALNTLPPIPHPECVGTDERGNERFTLQAFYRDVAGFRALVQSHIEQYRELFDLLDSCARLEHGRWHDDAEQAHENEPYA